MFALGCVPPPDDAHRRKYPMVLGAAPVRIRPVVMGITWFDSFWRPRKAADGSYWIGEDPASLGAVVGGHAICLLPQKWGDPSANWMHYNQGQEGACAGFAGCRMQSLYNKTLYNGFRLYEAARLVDGLPDTGDGTTIRAVMDILRTRGAWPVTSKVTTGPVLDHGISENRWCQSVDDAVAILGGGEYVQILNSWGSAGYPHITRMPVSTLKYMWDHPTIYVELMVATDKPTPYRR